MLAGVVVSTLAWNARDLGSIPALVAVITIYITRGTLVAVVLEPSLCVHVRFTSCVYVMPASHCREVASRWTTNYEMSRASVFCFLEIGGFRPRGFEPWSRETNHT